MELKQSCFIGGISRCKMFAANHIGVYKMSLEDEAKRKAEHRANFMKQMALRHNPTVSVEERRKLVLEMIDLETLVIGDFNTYCRFFNGEDFPDYHKLIDQYDGRFYAAGILQLIKLGCLPEEANKYEKRFECQDVLTLRGSGCSAEEANKYPTELDPWQLPLAAYLGITPAHLTGENKSTGLPLIKQLFSIHEDIRVFSDMWGSFYCVGIGLQGLLLFGKQSKSAYKIGHNLSEEARLYTEAERINGCLENIALCKGLVLSRAGVEIIQLEYIKGNSLEDVLKTRECFSVSDVLKYASGIMNGLVELRQAGIWYHRDIRPANIMIDDVNDRAVIIDLGIATTDKAAEPKDNLRYGCSESHANDLVSLAQIMYKMAVGEHLFKDSETMSRTTHLKLDIRDERVWVYQDPENRLKPYFEKIDKNISDERIQNLIKSCLTAKHFQYRKMQRMFERYAR